MSLRLRPYLPRAVVAALAGASVAATLCLGAHGARASRIEFTEYDLPNGLHVILSPDHTVPVVSSYVLYHVGSKNERADRTGFAHFFEHLMFEGSDNIPRGRLDKFVTGAGGNLNASTSFDQTEYHINLPANHLGLALWIESERMMHGKVEQIGVDTQRLVVKEERRRSYDNQPYGSMFEELSKLVFAGTPYAWVPIGSVQYIDQATLDEFRQFYKTYYVPNNATLAIAGDFDPAETKKQIELYFGPIPRSAEPPRPKMDFPGLGETAKAPGPSPAPPEKTAEPGAAGPTPAPAKVVEIRRQNTPLPATLHAWLGPRETDPDAYALEMLTNILAEGRSSRLYRRLVDQEQAAIEASAFPYFLEYAGMIGVFAVGNHGVTIPRLDGLIDEEVTKLKKDGVTEEEFQKARNQKESGLANSYGSVFSRARGLAQYHVFYGNTELLNSELDRYLKVTREDLKRVANRYLPDAGVEILHYPVPEPAGRPGAVKQDGPGPK